MATVQLTFLKFNYFSHYNNIKTPEEHYQVLTINIIFIGLIFFHFYLFFIYADVYIINLTSKLYLLSCEIIFHLNKKDWNHQHRISKAKQSLFIGFDWIYYRNKFKVLKSKTLNRQYTIYLYFLEARHSHTYIHICI